MLERIRGDDELAARPFSAFISYAHADEAAARRVQEAIESYRVPSRIVGMDGRFGSVPDRLKPVFRDRDELVAAPNLEAAIEEALGKSDALIVLCSPDAVASEWVNREIALFHAMRGGERIVAAFVGGNGVEEIVPPALLERLGVPLAADFRPQGDGVRLARLKVIAALLGTGLGVLEQRDAARRNRRLLLTAVASLAVALAFGVVAARAIRAEALARAEQARAERMVETLIADLREAVKPVGNLALLSRVNETALAYYRGQSLADMSDMALAQRAKLLHALGEDELARGSAGTARVHFAEAHRTTTARLAAAPEDSGRIFDQAQSEYWLAYSAWRAGRIAEASDGLKRYAALATALLEKEPNNPDWRLEAGYAESNLGVLALRQFGNGIAAEGRFASALAHFAAVQRMKPGDRSIAMEIADGLGWLADSHRAAGHLSDARQVREGQARLLDALAGSGNKGDLSLRAARVRNRLGQARIALVDQRAADAERHLIEALADAEALVGSDPANAYYAQERRMVALFLAQARLRKGHGGPDISALITSCDGGTGRTLTPEIRDFCLLTRARWHVSEGNPIEAARLAEQVAMRTTGAGRARLSEDYGIDFREEIANLQMLWHNS
jgi:hypothetical protein